MESALNQQPAAAPNGSAQSPVPAQIEAAIATLQRLADAEARRLPEAFQPALQTAHADLIVILSDLAKAVTAVRDGDPRQIGPAFEVALETANKWADRFCFDITEKPVWLDFETRAREVVESLPATITIEISDSELVTVPGDSPRVRVWKLAQRMHRRTRRLANRTQNGVRRLFGRPAVSLLAYQREIGARDFVANHAALPLAQQLTEIWLDAARQAANQAHESKAAVAETLERFISTDTFRTMAENPDGSAPLLAAFADRLRELLETADAPPPLSISAPRLAAGVTSAWGRAGTALLPNRSFSPARNAARRNRSSTSCPAAGSRAA